MTQALQSYAQGRWQDGTGEQRPLLDAATGEVVATIPARGPDVAAMLDYARTVGGPALRALTFTERAAILWGTGVGEFIVDHLEGEAGRPGAA
jgi:oxepin-CoA hydrolase / 3-oxo-5,6-dehydrosuberyl-CoA semialdehyde dehydrogenase